MKWLLKEAITSYFPAQLPCQIVGACVFASLYICPYLLSLSTFAKFGMPEWPTRRKPPGIPWQLDLEYNILLVIGISHYITQGWFPC